MKTNQENTEVMSISTGQLYLKTQSHQRFSILHLGTSEKSKSLFGVSGPKDSFWEIELTSSTGEKKVFKEKDTCWQGSVLKEQKNKELLLVLNWDAELGKDDYLRVIVTGRFEKASKLSYWSIKVKLPEEWVVSRVDFPVFSYIPANKGIKLAVPMGWGIEYDVKDGLNNEGLYPSCLASIQMLAFYKNGEGIYIATHDKNAHHKEFRAKADKGTAEFRLINWTAYPEKKTNQYQLPYEVCIGTYLGDYHQAADIYREFSFQTKWGNIKPISKRNIPDWLKRTDLWLRPDGNEPTSYPMLKEALAYYDVPVALHWYRWHQIPYDTLYPEYFPARPEFKKQVKECQQAGTYVMPYINGRLWDPITKTWKSKKAYDNAVKQENGEFVTEIYGSKVPLHPMCPSSKLWKDTVTNLVKRLFKEINVNGVYIDQIGASWPHRCFNPKHKHALGGGDFWYQEYRQMLDQIRKVVPKGRMITTEENSECWVDQFDAQLVLNMHASAGKWIPLYPLVYADRVISFGFLYFPEGDFDKSLPFRVKMQKCLLYGSQLGWIFPNTLMKPEYHKDREFLKELAKVRAFAHDFVAGGQLLGLLDVGGKNPKVKGEGKCIFGPVYKIDQKSVEASVWKSEKNQYGILLANVGQKEYDVELNLPETLVPVKALKNKTIKIYTPDGLAMEGKLKNSTLIFRMPASSGLVIKIG